MTDDAKMMLDGFNCDICGEKCRITPPKKGKGPRQFGVTCACGTFIGTIEVKPAALSQQPAAVDADRDPLVDRLTGRAAYLDSFGSVKDRDLMHSAAQEITALRNALAQPQVDGVPDAVVEPKQRAVEPCGGKGFEKTFRPKSGRALVSGPHMDNMEGYVFLEYDILWANDTFVLYGNEGFWPNLARWEHVIAKPMPAPQPASEEA